MCERGWKKGQKNKKILLNFIYIYFLCEQSEQNVFRRNNCFAGFFLNGGDRIRKLITRNKNMSSFVLQGFRTSLTLQDS